MKRGCLLIRSCEAEKCRANSNKATATCRDFIILPFGNELILQRNVAKIGPVSVAIDTSRYTFQLYESGVYDDQFCSSTSLDHAVLVVGYGTESNRQDYWLVKNSWGTEWGDAGYIKMSRNKNNQCGIATFAVYPMV
ncbi:hypothetical protein NFI96_034276 [Prochilodus magdalenae]|nr:hypothetical protein NFI96_034276 [Prochilodus magdalenae]